MHIVIQTYKKNKIRIKIKWKFEPSSDHCDKVYSKIKNNFVLSRTHCDLVNYNE